MEHHLLPKEPIPATPAETRVPCVCVPPYYDGETGLFLTYPRTKNKPWLVLKHRDTDFIAQIGTHERLHPQPAAELEVFYQEWLFFGFLKEVLGTDFDADAFVFTDAGERFTTTSTLLSILEEAFNRRFSSTPFDEAAFDHIADCSFAVSSVVKTTQLAARLSSPLNYKIMLSIVSSTQMIVTSFCHALKQHYGAVRHIPMPNENIAFPNDDVNRTMKDAGWCSSELDAMTTKFFSLQTLVALSRMDRLFLGRNHDGCTKRRCEWYQTNPESYEQKHRDVQPDMETLHLSSACCSCEHYKNDKLDADVRNILIRNNGNLPVLDISGDGEDLRIEVVEADIYEATPGIEYVAISHVWADGLGNPHGNSLPRCQLGHLRRLAEDLRTKAKHDGKLYIWIDTLCCPCDPKLTMENSAAKKIAIHLLRSTYRKATYVLVLDAALQALSLAELPAWETLLWIFTSGWTSRLWCLQEGVLPQSLWFQFQDQPEALAVLKDRLRKEIQMDPRVRSMNYDLNNQFLWLEQVRSPQPFYTDNYGKLVGALTSLTFAIQHRSVSVASDEALCISTLMKLPLEKLQEVPEQVEDRMCKLWELIDSQYTEVHEGIHTGIPVGILTLGYPKLRRPGFRWAPRTFLEKPDSNWVGHLIVKREGRILENPLYTQAGGSTSPPRYLGLLVKSAGFIVQRRTWNDGLLNNPWEPMAARLKKLACASFRDTASGEFYTFDCTKDNKRLMAGQHELDSGYNHLDTGACALLIFSGHSHEEICTALLGKLQLLGDGRHQITETVPVSFYRQTPVYNLIFTTAETIARSARSQSCVRRMDVLRRSGDKSASRKEFRALKDELVAFFRLEAGRKLEDEAIMAAVATFGNSNPIMPLAVAARDWFFNDYEGRRYGEEKEWIID